jgi:metal-dependent HD superfamily phosphatase/phosphodiesterase
MQVEIRADGQTAPYADGESLYYGTATTEAGVLRIANRARVRHGTGVRVYVDGKRQIVALDGRGPWARIVAIVCDA